MIARRALPALLLAPGVARAQRRPPTVAFVGFGSVEADRLSVIAFREGMQSQGQVEGRGWRFEHRHADGDTARGLEIIRDFAAMPVDVFLVPGPSAARAVRRATAIPLVAVGLPPVQGDPELFASLARPGGSVTGFASFGEEMAAKRAELLREMIPGLATIGVLHNATDPTFDAWGRMTAASARGMGLDTLLLPLTSPDPAALQDAMAALAARGGRALIVVRDFLTSSMIEAIIATAMAHRIAVVADQARFAQAGALMSYGASLPDLFRRAAGYVVRILRGERPGDLPVQLPTAIEFVVNLRTARALGLTVPHAILARAEDVIE
ncbi:ABC transporter substrate-binding protein [Roseomonas sp. PWR1]|uniref:ABC transporter substrate-binding protein n=1 Tax=Roseomonas nitratireducens TaxID=2820810 RepID=A0ABS4AQH0_9PROT|nr:ABC transporter substrate-binding protein [Neoroseomonas nitratireducens]MBP0463484.1 ABC transporter substrate-binding protein [Neoroseomonas nitratireducens]